MTFNQYVMDLARSSMVIKYTLLAVMEISKFKCCCKNRDFVIFRYTEIWSLDGESKIIKLAEPRLNSYYKYPALLLVDTNFCVKP